jgi:hypothetical protein
LGEDHDVVVQSLFRAIFNLYRMKAAIKWQFGSLHQHSANEIGIETHIPSMKYVPSAPASVKALRFAPTADAARRERAALTDASATGVFQL